MADKDKRYEDYGVGSLGEQRIVKCAHCGGDGSSTHRCCTDRQGINHKGCSIKVVCCACGGSGRVRV